MDKHYHSISSVCPLTFAAMLNFNILKVVRSFDTQLQMPLEHDLVSKHPDDEECIETKSCILIAHMTCQTIKSDDFFVCIHHMNFLIFQRVWLTL